MEEFWFYLEMGLHHVLDFGAYDHILFLSALAIPFTFKSWKRVLVLATVFTVTHCVSLALSVYEVATVDVSLIEFLIPVTIMLTALYNIYELKNSPQVQHIWLHSIATAFFGLIHGFGFSNYFKMLMAEEEDKVVPLLGFAGGIELSQLSIILCVLLLAFLTQSIFKLKQSWFIIVCSLIIVAITIPLLINTFPF